jgi:hypothetical protein
MHIRYGEPDAHVLGDGSMMPDTLLRVRFERITILCERFMRIAYRLSCWQRLRPSVSDS